jgi:hypothetical protein
LPNDTLADRIGSAYDAQETSEVSTVEEPTSEAPAASPIGIEDGSPSQGDQGSAQQVALELAETLAPDTVIGTIDGKPVTASEFRDSYMRTQDYTRKTTELAQQRQEAQAYIDWYKANENFIQGLNSPNPDDRKATLEQIAQQFGVELSPRPRDASGRFVAQSQQEDAIDLSQYDENDAAYELASALNQERANRSQLESKLDSLQSSFEKFTNSVTTQVEAQQRQAEVEAIAASWTSHGLQDVDVNGALQLVGKPISTDQAMRLHHFEKLLRHNYNVAKTPSTPAPNEPAPGSSNGRGSLRGMGLSQAYEERIR